MGEDGRPILPRAAGEGPRDSAVEGAVTRDVVHQGCHNESAAEQPSPARASSDANFLRPKLAFGAACARETPGLPAFRRQHPMGPYVLDFYCAKARLAIEIDGIAHDMGDRPQRDLRRQGWLEAQGISVVRIPASELARRFDETADAVMRMAIAMVETSTALRAVHLPIAHAPWGGRAPILPREAGEGDHAKRGGGGEPATARELD